MTDSFFISKFNIFMHTSTLQINRELFDIISLHFFLHLYTKENISYSKLYTLPMHKN